MEKREWAGFNEGNWNNEINVRDFINKNVKPYLGDESFLTGTSEKTRKLWDECMGLIKAELKKGVLAARKRGKPVKRTKKGFWLLIQKRYQV
jgi:formate C-acetyltransferase